MSGGGARTEVRRCYFTFVRGVKNRRALLNRTPAGTGEGIKNNRSEKSERLEKRSTIIFREFAA